MTTTLEKNRSLCKTTATGNLDNNGKPFETNEPGSQENEGNQFEISDTRTLDEIVHWLISMDYIPSFCTACYRQGRTGDRFMQLCKTGQLQNVCHSNSLMTLKEYEMDYAAEHTKSLANRIIRNELQNIPHPKIKKQVEQNLHDIVHNNSRDFRF